MHRWIQSVEAGGGKIPCLPDSEESKHRKLESWPKESKESGGSMGPKESKGPGHASL